MADHETRSGDTGAPGTSPPDTALEHDDDEGNTPAAWIACGSVIVASVVGGFAVVFASWLLGVVAVAVAVVGLLVGIGMSRASGGARGGIHGEHGVEAHGAGTHPAAGDPA